MSRVSSRRTALYSVIGVVGSVKKLASQRKHADSSTTPVPMRVGRAASEIAMVRRLRPDIEISA